jgi:hypothetical protein
MTMEIVSAQQNKLARRNAAPDVEAHILAMWLLFCSRPKKAEPEPDGSYLIGDVGSAPEKTWERLTPYSLAVPRLERNRG